MTPVYLNPPSSPFSSVDQQTHEDQRLKLFISSSSPYNQASASCSLSSPTFFDSLEPQTGTATTSLVHQSQLYNHKADNPTWHGGTSYDDQVCSSSSSLVDQPAAVVLDVSNNKDHKLLSTSTTTERDEVNLGDEESSKSKNNNNRTVKWMSSKMRLMQKMANPTSDHNINAHKIPTTTAQQQQQQPLENNDTSSLISNSSSCNTTATTTTTTAVTVRVCSDCNTNTTPLWRSGPRGPKSLCNACGIRQRKARRAMVEAAAAAAANGVVVGSGTAIDTSTSFMKVKVANKEKKSRGGTGSHVAQRHKINNKSKFIITDDTGTSCSTTSHSTHHHNKRNKLCFKTSFQRLFPQDVAEAAVLLMELSCGLINHSS